MYTLIGDPLFFRINKLNNVIWNKKNCYKQNLEEYIGKQYDVETDAKRIEDNFRFYYENNQNKFDNLKLMNLIFKSFKGSYIILFLLKLSSILTMCFLAFSLKSFRDGFGQGSEYVKGTILIINQIIEVLFNIYVDYYAELLHIRVRGSLTLFIITLLLKGKIIHSHNNRQLYNTDKFAKIQNIISVDGEFSEYMISYIVELILFPFNLLLLFGISSIFIGGKSVWLCIGILTLLGIISIGSQWISSSYKKQFMEHREERIAYMTQLLSENDDFILTHIYDLFYLNLIDKFRKMEMKFNKYRKYWFCIGEVISYWMEILCTIAICLYCYFNQYSNLKISSILTNCSFIVPVLVKPISSIAYFTYYLTEALNALTRINSIINNFQYNDDLKYLKIQNKISLENIEYIQIKDVSSDQSNIILQKGIINIIIDSNNNQFNHVNFFKQLLISSNDEFKSFYIYLKLNNHLNNNNNLLCVPNFQLINKSICYVNKKPWIFENSTIKEAIICDKSFNESLWNLVIMACQLNIDINNGHIKIDENINIRQISTGQRARISLARSLYNALYNHKEKKSCIYLIENIFDCLDKSTSCKLIYLLFSKNQPYYGLLSSSFGIISIGKELYNFFIYTVYFKIYHQSSLINYDQTEYIMFIELKNKVHVKKVELINSLFDNTCILKDIQNYLNEDFQSKNVQLINNYLDDNIINKNYCIDIDNELDNLIITQKKFISNSLYYYLFQTSDQVKYKYNNEMNKLISIKRSKSLIFIYLLLSIIPMLIFKISEYSILSSLIHSTTLFKDLFKYIYLSLIILFNYFITIFLEIYIGLKSANYIHNTVIYGYLSTYSLLKIIPVSNVIGHLTNDQIVIDYCITKRIGQILNYLNKILAFIIISIMINSNNPISFFLFALLYILFIYWNFLSYFINTCRVLRLKFLSSLASLTDTVHSINKGIEDIQNNNLEDYFKEKCLINTRSFLLSLYTQNILFTWLRLRIDFLLPITLNTMNIILPIIFSNRKDKTIPAIFIYVIGVGLTIPKMTSSAVKYWIKLESELLAVTRIKQLLDILQNNNSIINLGINNNDSSLILSLNNVDGGYYGLKNSPFSQILNEYQRLKYNKCLKKININIKRGDVIGVIGRTGSGKTSLLKLFGGILEINSGKRTFHFGEDNNNNNNDNNKFKNDKYKIEEFSLKKFKKISSISEIDPLILLNSVKDLEFSSYIAYLPIKVNFPSDITLMELLYTNNHYISEILDLLCLFNLIYRKCDPNEELIYNEYSNLLNKEFTEILNLPINYFGFDENQCRILLLIKFALNSKNYKMLLVDEPPSNVIFKENSEISIIDYIIKNYFQDCSVIIATHKIENISTINRLISINEDHTINELDI